MQDMTPFTREMHGSHGWQKFNDFILGNLLSFERVVQDDAFNLSSRFRVGENDSSRPGFLASR